jgi:outer membrane immunogenic protein
MKKLILAACAVLLLSAGVDANAADMPWRAPIAKAPPPVAPNWTGLYVGGHLGAGFSTKEWEVTDPNIVLPIHFGSDAVSGFLAGAQIGVNYQVDALVFGIEADASWANLSGETCNTGQSFHCFSKVDRFGTVAGRAGIATDRALVYIRGGAAWVHDTHVMTPIVLGFDTTASGSKWGWTAGAGLEYALTRNWSAKLEYDFMDFGTSQYTFDFPLASTIVATDIKQRLQTVTFGLNYRFDWGSGGASY